MAKKFEPRSDRTGSMDAGSGPMDSALARERNSQRFRAGQRRLFVHAVSVAGAVLTWSCALPLTAVYGQNSAVIMVNGNSQGIPAGMVNSNNANGSNVAAAAVYNGKTLAESDQQVNSAAATNSEAAAIAKLTASAAGNPKFLGNVLVANPALQAFQKTILTGTAPDAGGKGNFALVAKANIGKSMTKSLAPTNNAGVTIATAVATANQTINGMKVTFGDSLTSGAGGVAAGVGVAFTSHHDPFEVDWTSAGSRSLTLDLSTTSFTLSTQGSGSAAVGFLGISASINDNTTNINVPESLATPLFSLTVPVISSDGGPAQIYRGAADLTLTTGTIMDNLGNMGTTNVLNGLLGDLSISSNGTVSFLTPYMITDTIPGTATQSVVYLDQVTFGEAFVPEPSSIVLLVTGAVGMAALRWKTNRGVPTSSKANRLRGLSSFAS